MYVVFVAVTLQLVVNVDVTLYIYMYEVFVAVTLQLVVNVDVTLYIYIYVCGLRCRDPTIGGQR